MAEPPADWMEELFELLRIPSVSADPAHTEDVRRAGEWVRDFIRAAGGEAELQETTNHPLVIGEIRASENADTAPTVIAYGHFDVQPPRRRSRPGSRRRSSRPCATAGSTPEASPTTRASSTSC